MIIDFHTHIFPPAVRHHREEYLRLDPTFAEMYSAPRARIATAAELLHSMDGAGVDVSVALGFAWRDPDLCRRHNDYLLEAAAKSGSRLLPFCVVQPSDASTAEEAARCAAAGARGLGELRPHSQGYQLDGPAGMLLADIARQHRLTLLFHVSEPVGHDYPGKEGLPLSSFYRFLQAHPDLTVVGAHLGGGLPFLATMPSVRRALARTYVDTAALPYLYDETAYQEVARLIGAERILFGSDFPLLEQQCQIAAIRRSGLDETAQRLILGENAERVLSLGC